MIWTAVDELLAREEDPARLAWHGLHLLAIRRWRERGVPVWDPNLVEEERRAVMCALGAPAVLDRVRAALDGPVVLLKGYEIALLYGDPSLRRFADLDLLVEDSVTAQRNLIAAGFVEVGEPELFVDLHHRRPLWLPGFPLKIEVHHAPKWPDGIGSPPDTARLLDTAIPSASGVAGMSTLPPEQHALILAAHSWAHVPLRAVGELLDVALVTAGTDRARIAAQAAEWRIERIWRTTIGSVDALFYGRPSPATQRIWARHLRDVRERTVFESHLQKWISAFWALPRRRAFVSMASALAAEVVPAESETWREKGGRVAQALRNASTPRTQHDRELGPRAHRRRRT